MDELIFTTARITTRAASPELLALARERAVDPAIFDVYPPFVWQSEISSDRLDAYFTRMDPLTTLVNYARDAAAGVAVLVGHNVRELPIGQSLTGTLEAIGNVTRVLSDAYAIAEPGAASALTRLQAGIVRDVSVGFNARNEGAGCICGICGLDMWSSWDCWHVPGLVYEIKDVTASGTVVREVLCTATIVNAGLSEYSLVYDGATPNAAVIQARKAAEAGRLRPEQVRLLESRYRINLPGRRLLVPGATVIEGGEMPPEPQKTEETRAPAPIVVATMDEGALLPVLQRGGAAPELDLRAACEWAAAELARLRPLADDGRTYRTGLVDAAIAEGIRAHGAEFPEETYRATLGSMPLDMVKRMTADWKAIGDSKLPAGRQTVDTTEQTPLPAKRQAPDAAYQD